MSYHATLGASGAAFFGGTSPIDISTAPMLSCAHEGALVHHRAEGYRIYGGFNGDLV
jgi:hypothetical protein